MEPKRTELLEYIGPRILALLNWVLAVLFAFPLALILLAPLLF